MRDESYVTAVSKILAHSGEAAEGVPRSAFQLGLLVIQRKYGPRDRFLRKAGK
jgi:hypothetical protein